MEKEEAVQANADQPAPRKSKKRLFILIAVFVLLLGGGAGAFWMFQHKSDAPAEEPTETELLAFEPFVANLSDGDGRFLRLTLRLIVEAAEESKGLAEDTMVMAKVRSAILELLSEQTSSDLITPTGKAALKEAITERANAALEHAKVTDVLFTEFVIQF